ncbi:MAG: cytochrome bc complex cytochrome b subunit [Gammaproteobacteria bacterium]|nr:cytochrome bc complex cytochrome b subunit [Gammaproteobacteria bacterium]
MQGLLVWIDARFPLSKMWREHISEYYAPKNFNFWYYFGSLAMLVLVIQIVTGIFLTMSYKPSAAEAFASVEYIMRDVNWGWLIRYMHSTGASAFFVVVYLHMFRAVLYGSYKKPRELLWLLGMQIYVALMAEAFFGYLLPWGQMSYWGAQVIVSLFGAIPFGIGETLVEWVRGDYFISDITLNRFFALHVIAVPLALIFLVIAHLLALHEVGSNNPDGIEIKEKKGDDGIPLDGIPFHPYYTVKDIMGVAVFMAIFAAVVFFAPEMGGYFLEHANFEPANSLKTPEHIAPVWYFTPFYAILRAVPDKLLGVVLMAGAIVMLFILPWLDKSPVKSIRYRGWIFKLAVSLFAISFVALGYLGLQPVSAASTLASRFFATIYFLFFLLMPIYTRLDRTKPVPGRVT